MFQVAKSAISHGEEFKELHVLFIQGKKIRTRGCREIANGLDGQRHRQHKEESPEKNHILQRPAERLLVKQRLGRVLEKGTRE